jgi:signal peptidase II
MRLPRTERVKRLLLGLILGGAVGNLIDRVYDGAVIDFIEMGIGGHWWPVYNVADIGVTVGAVLLLWYLIMSQRGEPQAAKDSTARSDDVARPQTNDH